MISPDTTLQKISIAISDVLTRDERLREALAGIQPCVLQIDIDGIAWRLYVEFEQGKFCLRGSAPARAPDLLIKGPPLSLLALLRATDGLQQAQRSGVTIQGDLHIARRLSDSLLLAQPDWEAIAATFVGDAAAWRLSTAVTSVARWRQRLHDSLRHALREYLQEETQASPTRVEVEHFLDEVDGVRDGVARLEARLTRLRH